MSTDRSDEWEPWVAHRIQTRYTGESVFHIAEGDRLVAVVMETADADRILADHAAARDLPQAQERIRDLETALRNRSEEFHDYIRITAEPGNHMHHGPGGDPRWMHCIHAYCSADRALLSPATENQEAEA